MTQQLKQSIAQSTLPRWGTHPWIVKGRVTAFHPLTPIGLPCATQEEALTRAAQWKRSGRFYHTGAYVR